MVSFGGFLQFAVRSLWVRRGKKRWRTKERVRDRAKEGMERGCI
jgi:hypothetical protein